MKARIVVENLRPAYIHTLTVNGVRDGQGNPLLHPTAYYTLNNIPDGEKLSTRDVSTKNSAIASAAAKPKNAGKKSEPVAKQSTAKTMPATSSSKPPGFFEVKGLLVNYTCTACHTTREKQIGPGYMEIAKRNYSNEKIVSLIHNPQPQNWPDYETAMPPMPQVAAEDAYKIAAWINSLDD
jgi:cytochrome c551/c552